MAEVAEVCRDFRNNGSCRRGDNCRFEHSAGEPIQVPSKPPGQCFKFQEGNCVKGDSCRFMHGEDDQRFDSEGKRDVSNEICNNYKRGRCALGDKCLRQHVEVEAKEQSDEPRRRRRRGPKMCRNFKESGECADGDNCRFKHGPEDTRFANDDAEDSAPRRRERAPKKKAAKKARGPCFTFRDEGACERGDECKFTHGDNDTRFPEEPEEDDSSSRRRRPRREQSSTDPVDEVCNNYAAGRCRFGDSCRRQHVGDVAPVPVEKIDEICNNFQSGRCRFGEFCRRQHVTAAE